MSNIYLRPGEANPANIRLRDPAAADSGGSVSLTANGLTTGAPTLGAPTLTQVHVLTAAALTTGTPVLATPALAQVHVLAANGLTTGAPVLGQATLAGETPAPVPVVTPALFRPDVSVMQAFDLKRKLKRRQAFLLLG